MMPSRCTAPQPSTCGSEPGLGRLPPELIIMIMERFSCDTELENFAASYGRAAVILKANGSAIFRSIIQNSIAPSNLDIALTTFSILRFSSETSEFKHMIWAFLATRPTLDFLNNNAESLEDLLALAGKVNLVADLYMYPDFPSTFWAQAWRKYDRCWPSEQRAADGPITLSDSDQERCRKIACHFWSIRRTALEAAEGKPLNCPPAAHSAEYRAKIQRQVWALELQNRVSILDTLDVPGGPWEDDEPSTCLVTFINFLTQVYVHTLGLNEGLSDEKVMTYLQATAWRRVNHLGVRFWASILRKGPARVRWRETARIVTRIDAILGHYVSPRRQAARLWLYELQQARWLSLQTRVIAANRVCGSRCRGAMGTLQF